MPSDSEFGPEGPTAFEWREYLGEEDWETPDSDHIVVFGRHPRDPRWAVRATFEVQQSDVNLAKLTIHPVGHWAPPQGLTDEVRRTVSLTALRRQVLARLQRQDIAARVDVNPAGFTGGKHRGRPGRTDEDYARIARRYVELLADDSPVIPALAAEQKLSHSAIRGVLWEARRRGLLSRSPGAGQPGGYLTDRAKRVLDAPR